ncbi:MAG TPA: VOC family protein [Devosiaceae bacterium]|nr:VOC family protein [Devosiaceae bacterium]
MIDHIGLRTTRFEDMTAFYASVLKPLGYEKLMEFPDAAGFGKDGDPAFWLSLTDVTPTGIHLAMTAPTRAAVDEFFASAMAAGARDNGPPGLRDLYGPDYYAAFVYDLDGNNLEAVCQGGQYGS